MTILDLRNPSQRPGRNKLAARVWVGFALIAAVLGVGSTIAANITINGGQTAEFGQGAQHTIYCGAGHDEGVKIELTPFSKYSPTPYLPTSISHRNESETAGNSDTKTSSVSPSSGGYDGSGSFSLGGVTVSNIPPECSGVDFVITFYDTNGEAIDLHHSAGGVTSPTVWFVNGCGVITEECPDLMKKQGGQGSLLSGQRTSYVPTDIARVTSTSSSFTITLTPNINGDKISTDSISDITIETQNDTFGLDEFRSNPTVKALIRPL